MTLLVMKRSRVLFFVCLLSILIPLLQAAAGPGLVAENLDRVDFDDLPTATSQSQQTRHADQELTGKALKSDCLEELPARMHLRLSDLPVLNADVRLGLIVNPEAGAPNTRIRIILPEGLSLSKGSLQCYGDLLRNHGRFST